MNSYLILPILTGVSIVTQAFLNRSSSISLGLTTTVLINAIVFLAASAALWFSVKAGWIPLTGSLGAGVIKGLGYKNIIPGLCGLVIVIATPISLMHLGAATTFSLVIATQLLLSVALDVIAEGRALTWPLVAGATIMVLGCLLMLNESKFQS